MIAVLVALCLTCGGICIAPAEAAQHASGSAKTTAAKASRTSKKTSGNKIVYKLNGGSFKSAYRKTYRSSKGLAQLVTPYRKGYSFVGWRNRTASGRYVKSIRPGSRGTRVLYAQWRKRVVIAHMGYHQGAMSNSIKAYENAAKKGFEQVEADVRFTADGKPVLAHDYTIKVYEKDEFGKKTGKPFNVDIETLTLDEIQNDYIAQHPRGAYAYPKTNDALGDEGVADNDEDSDAIAAQAAAKPYRKNIAELGELLDICRKHKMMPNLDLKSCTKREAAQLVKVARKHRMASRVRWLSFSPTQLKRIKRLHKHAKFGLLAGYVNGSKVSAAKMLAKKRSDVIIFTYAIGIEYSEVKRCKKAHVALGIWTVRDETKASHYNRYISAFIIAKLKHSKVPELI